MMRIANWISVGALALVIALATSLVAASAYGLLPSAEHGTLNPESYVLPLPQAAPPANGIEAPDPTLTVDKNKLQQRLDALGTTTGTHGYCVMDLSGTVVASRQATSPKMPASSWKTLVSMGVLSAYGSNYRFSTTVVTSSSGIVIVGGGDPYLTAGKRFHPWQASAQVLADQVAAVLKERKRTSIQLGYDTSLFSGPGWNPNWDLPDSEGWITTLSALSIDARQASAADTTMESVTKFRNLLADRGITVTSVKSEKAKDGAETIARVESLPLGLAVQRTMETSDNFASETFFYHISVAAGLTGSYKDAQSALTTYLKSAGLWADGMVVSDGSGLSELNKVPPTILAKAVLTAMRDPKYSEVLRGMPVAGVEGTLANRFDDSDEAAARGVVRAKTGMLEEGRTLTGVAQTKSGAVLVFSFMVSNVRNHGATLDWLDEAAAVLASA